MSDTRSKLDPTGAPRFTVKDVSVFCVLTMIMTALALFGAESSWRSAVGHDSVAPTSVSEALDRDSMRLDEMRRDVKATEQTLEGLQQDVTRAKLNSGCRAGG